MIQRCHNPSDSSYAYYGGRGIAVCPRWRKSLRNFVLDMGEKPKGKTLDRIDNNGSYSKKNCRWATREEQRANQRIAKNARILTYKGERKTVAQWAKKFKIPYITLHARIHRYGYTVAKALTA